MIETAKYIGIDADEVHTTLSVILPALIHLDRLEQMGRYEDCALLKNFIDAVLRNHSENPVGITTSTSKENLDNAWRVLTYNSVPDMGLMFKLAQAINNFGTQLEGIFQDEKERIKATAK